MFPCQLDSNARLNKFIRAGDVITIRIPEERKQPAFNVRTLDGRELPVTTQLSNTVASLKDNITQWTGIPQGEQRLLLKGKELKDDRRLDQYCIGNGTMLHLGRPLEDCRQVVTTIIVGTPNGASFGVEVDLAETVGGLKEKIQERAGVPAGVQILSTDERLIAGEDHLCDHGLEAGSTVYMHLHSARITSPEQVARLQGPPAAHPVHSAKAPIFREAEDVGELVQSDRPRSVSLYKDARNWVAQSGPRFGWDPRQFDPVAHLDPNPDDEVSIQDYYRHLKIFSRPHANDFQRQQAAYIRALLALISAVRPYRAAANLTSVNQLPRHHPGITLGGGSTGVSTKQTVSLGADVNNWAPDAFSDSDVMRLFEVAERVRQALARAARTGEGILSIDSQRRINSAILLAYSQALAGHQPPVEYNQARKDEECAICRDELTAGSALQLACKHKYHADCILTWATVMYQKAIYPSCPYCKQGFSLPYADKGATELESLELNQANRDE